MVTTVFVNQLLQFSGGLFSDLSRDLYGDLGGDARSEIGTGTGDGTLDQPGSPLAT